MHASPALIIAPGCHVKPLATVTANCAQAGHEKAALHGRPACPQYVGHAWRRGTPLPWRGPIGGRRATIAALVVSGRVTVALRRTTVAARHLGRRLVVGGLRRSVRRRRSCFGKGNTVLCSWPLCRAASACEAYAEAPTQHKPNLRMSSMTAPQGINSTCTISSIARWPCIVAIVAGRARWGAISTSSAWRSCAIRRGRVRRNRIIPLLCRLLLDFALGLLCVEVLLLSVDDHDTYSERGPARHASITLAFSFSWMAIALSMRSFFSSQSSGSPPCSVINTCTSSASSSLGTVCVASCPVSR